MAKEVNALQSERLGAETTSTGVRPPSWSELVKQSISAMTDLDEPLLHRFLSTSHWPLFPFSYEGSFAFYSHRAGYFPMKFYDGHLLAVFYLRDGAYSVLRPLGQWNPATVGKLAQYLFGLSQRRVSFLKLTYHQFIDLSSIPGFAPMRETRNLMDIGDDRYPQLVISVQKLLRSIQDTPAIKAGAFPEFSYLRRILRVFERRYSESFVLYRFDERHLMDIEHLIAKWKADFLSRYRRDHFETLGDDRANLIFPDDGEFLVRPYRSLLHGFCKTNNMRNNFGFVAYLQDEPVGFVFLSRTAANCVSLYANLALTAYRGLSYYLLYTAIKELSAYPIEYVNLGGQETNSLRRYYLRFNPFPLEEKETRSYDLQFDLGMEGMEALPSAQCL